MMAFRCATCDKWHDALPVFGADRPDPCYDVPEERRSSDVFLTSDTCVVADKFFFVRGCVDIPIVDAEEMLSFGVWVSLEESNFFAFQDCLDEDNRSHIGPFFGWLCTDIACYELSPEVKTIVHLRDHGLRPQVEIDPSDCLVGRDQAEGITLETALSKLHSMYEANGEPWPES